jgi:hypothetical protein
LLFAQVAEETRNARDELLSFRHGLLDSGDDAEVPTSAAKARSCKRRHAKQGEKLQQLASEGLSQLRLACIHPQVGVRT